MNIGDTFILRNDPEAGDEPTAMLESWIEVEVKSIGDAGVRVRSGGREATVEAKRLLPLQKFHPSISRIRAAERIFPQAKKALEELWPDLFGVVNIDVPSLKTEPHILAVNRDKDDALIRLGEKSTSFVLNEAYEWKIERTDKGMLLIPKEPR